jgi:ATP synthase protein I
MSERKPGNGDAPDAGRPPDAERPPRALSEEKPFHFWRLVATVSSLGWSLVLPPVAGAFLGNYLDKLTGQEYIWTIGLLFAGVALSLYNLYHILYKETIE